MLNKIFNMDKNMPKVKAKSMLVGYKIDAMLFDLWLYNILQKKFYTILNKFRSFWGTIEAKR